MAKGVKTGGRKKGTPNKGNLQAIQGLIDLGVNPLDELAAIALDEKDKGDKGDKQLAASCWKELAQYYAPKRKSIEHSGNAENPINHVHEVKFKIT